eukprot:11967668-Alexandrium_andersonii.AAC.1
MGDGDKSQTFGSTLHDACQLGFAGTQSNGLLGRGPMQNRAPTARAHAAASRPAGVEATRK